MNKKEAIANLNHIYGMVAPDIQRSLDVAIKALERPQGDLISREALKKEVYGLFCPDGYKLDFIRYIDNAPTVETRTQGEWTIIKSPLSNETIVKCDKCGDEFIGNDVENYNFCPICGANMKGGEDK